MEPTELTDEQVKAFAKIVGEKRKAIAERSFDLAGCLYTAFHAAAGNRKPGFERVPAWEDLKERIVIDAWRHVAEESLLHWVFTDRNEIGEAPGIDHIDPLPGQ